MRKRNRKHYLFTFLRQKSYFSTQEEMLFFFPVHFKIIQRNIKRRHTNAHLYECVEMPTVTKWNRMMWRRCATVTLTYIEIHAEHTNNISTIRYSFQLECLTLVFSVYCTWFFVVDAIYSNTFLPCGIYKSLFARTNETQ